MYFISRKWKAAKNGEPPCCGQYKYTIDDGWYIILDNLTEKEYNAWKTKVIKERWKK